MSAVALSAPALEDAAGVNGPIGHVLAEVVAAGLGTTPAALWDFFARERAVLILDDFDGANELAEHLRTAWLPRLPANVLVVALGQHPPLASWRRAPWARLMHHEVIAPLDREAVKRYAAHAGVEPGSTNAVWTLCYGYPEALALACEVANHHVAPALTEHPEVFETVVARFSAELSNRRLREAVELVAVAGFATADLMQSIGIEDRFERLHTLSFVDANPGGLHIVEGISASIAASLEWRDPVRFAALRRAIYEHHAARLLEARGHEQERIVAGLLFLMRGREELEPVISWRDLTTGHFAPAVPGDHAAILRAVARHEGPQSVALVNRWLQQAPSACRVGWQGFRAGAFVMALALGTADLANLGESDPVLRAGNAWLERHGPLRSGERVLFIRSWMAFDRYQGTSAMVTACVREMARAMFQAEGYAAALISIANPRRWAPTLATIGATDSEPVTPGLTPSPQAVFGIDWRPIVASSWLSVLNRPAICASGACHGPRADVFDEATFLTLVKEALKSYSEPSRLFETDLTRAHLVLRAVRRNPTPERCIAALRAALDEAVDTMERSPRHEQDAQLIRHTWLEPSGTQEEIARQLGLPFGTYRRHLARAAEHIGQLLWQRELAR